MSNELVETKSVNNKPKLDIGQLENVFIKGDIGEMNELQRIDYVRQVCKTLGLNPLTQPFDYITFQGGKIQLYAKKACTDQLRSNYGISVAVVGVDLSDGILTVTARAKTADGRHDEDIGCVHVGHLKGDALANAKMKAVTKAKRRVTLSICGLGMLDESETENIPNAQKMNLKITEEVKAEVKPLPNRDAVYKEILALKNPFQLKFPDVDLGEKLKKRFGHSELGKLTIEENRVFLDWMKSKMAEPDNKKEALPEEGESKNKWFEDPHPGLENERYVK